jgi:hypothetical protein
MLEWEALDIRLPTVYVVGMKTIKLPCFGIVVQYDSFHGGGTITSGLREDSQETNMTLEGGIDAIEALILAQACAGIDIESPAYIESLKTAIEAILNNGD